MRGLRPTLKAGPYETRLNRCPECTSIVRGSVYQFGEAATKFHIKNSFNVGVYAWLMCQRIKFVFQ